MKHLSLLTIILSSTFSGHASDLVTLMGTPDESLAFVQEILERKIDLINSAPEMAYTTVIYSVLANEGVRSASAVSLSGEPMHVTSNMLIDGIKRGSAHSRIFLTYFGPLQSRSLCDYITMQANTIFVVPAGASGSNANDFPLSCISINIVRVGALNREKTDLHPTSDYGDLAVNIAAPGFDIPVTEMGGRQSRRNGITLAAAIVAARLADYSRRYPRLRGASLVNAFYKNRTIPLEALNGKVQGSRAIR